MENLQVQVSDQLNNKECCSVGINTDPNQKEMMGEVGCQTDCSLTDYACPEVTTAVDMQDKCSKPNQHRWPILQFQQQPQHNLFKNTQNGDKRDSSDSYNRSIQARGEDFSQSASLMFFSENSIDSSIDDEPYTRQIHFNEPIHEPQHTDHWNIVRSLHLNNATEFDVSQDIIQEVSRVEEELSDYVSPSMLLEGQLGQQMKPPHSSRVVKASVIIRSHRRPKKPISRIKKQASGIFIRISIAIATLAGMVLLLG